MNYGCTTPRKLEPKKMGKKSLLCYRSPSLSVQLLNCKHTYKIVFNIFTLLYIAINIHFVVVSGVGPVHIFLLAVPNL